MNNDANLRRARAVYGWFVLMCTLGLCGLVAYKLYLGPYAKRYEDRLEAWDAARNLMTMDNSVCLPENIVRTGSVERCIEAERVLGRCVWYGALIDTLDRMTVFSWIFGSDSYSFFSPEQLFRLASVSVILIATLWVLSACSFLVSGHQASVARYEMPYAMGKHPGYGPVVMRDSEPAAACTAPPTTKK